MLLHHTVETYHDSQFGLFSFWVTFQEGPQRHKTFHMISIFLSLGCCPLSFMHFAQKLNIPQFLWVVCMVTILIFRSCWQTDLDGNATVPYPATFDDTWDDIHVKMPCSSKNLFPVQDEVMSPFFFSRGTHGKSKQTKQNGFLFGMKCHETPLTKLQRPQETRELQNKSRWELIKQTLKRRIGSTPELKVGFLTALLLSLQNYAFRWRPYSTKNETDSTWISICWVLFFAQVERLNFFLCVTECHIEILRFYCQEVGLHCIAFVLH